MQNFGISPFNNSLPTAKFRDIGKSRGRKLGKSPASDLLFDIFELGVNLLLLPVYFLTGAVSLITGVLCVILAIILISPLCLLVILIL